MPSKRYIVTTLPIEHINGKIANSSVRCPNSDTERENTGFLYGYRHRNDLNTSRFGVRVKSRNLTQKPYTDKELLNKRLFMSALTLARSVIEDDITRQVAAQEFAKQNRYLTLRGYIIATIRNNGGLIPSHWLNT